MVWVDQLDPSVAIFAAKIKTQLENMMHLGQLLGQSCLDKVCERDLTCSIHLKDQEERICIKPGSMVNFFPS